MKAVEDRLATGIFLAFLGLYGLTASGHLYLADAWSVLETARSLLLEGDLTIDFDPGFGGDHDDQGRFYSQYGLGAVFLSLPTAAAGILLERLGPPQLGTVLVGLPHAFLNVLVCAGILTVFFRIVCRDLGPRPALQATVLLGLTSPVWTYSRFDATEPWLALFLLIAVDRLDRPTAPNATVAGLAMGLAFLVKFTIVLTFPALLWHAWTRVRQDPDLRERDLIPAAIGPALAGLLFLAYNALRFGDPLKTGYAVAVQTYYIPVWMGLFGLLVSPGKGLFWYAPLTLVLLRGPGLDVTPSRFRLACGITLPSLIFFAFQQNWDGDIAYGPRYLMPFVPLLYLPLARGFDRARGMSRIGLILLASAGVVVQSAGILVDHSDFFRFLSSHKARLGDYHAEDSDKVHIPFHPHHFNPDFSPIRGHLFLFARHVSRSSNTLRLYSTIEEANDTRGHRLLLPVELGVEDPDWGRPDLWWILLTPLLKISRIGPLLYVLLFAGFSIALLGGRRRIRSAQRLGPPE